MDAQRYAIVDLIRHKRDGGTWDDEQVGWIIDAYTGGVIADEQMAALAMAIYFRGMEPAELGTWTRAMIDTGTRLDYTGLGRPTADKHSTGGVGDKITLALTPLVAACGVAVPQLSGRGLGHTGGTLDKLESIPGWRSDLDSARVRRQLGEVGAVIVAAGPDLAPADRKLYALRDVTGTVESIELIASSIMSKKIAEGTETLVLDVKVGSGAFMKSVDDARRLATTMVGLGEEAGLRTSALLTDMSTPLGLGVGNALEVAEAVEVLAGGGPPDVVELTLALAREMVSGAGRDVDVAQVLASGRAMDAWRSLVRAQDGDPDAPLPRARHTETIPAPRDGRVAELDAMAVGWAAWRLGAGRSRKEDPVQPGAGVQLHAQRGDTVREGQPLATVHTDSPEAIAPAVARLSSGVRIAPTTGGDTPTPPALVLERIGC